jgi:hypothetical protein
MRRSLILVLSKIAGGCYSRSHAQNGSNSILETLSGLCEKTLATFGDKFYIKHSSLLNQDGRSLFFEKNSSDVIDRLQQTLRCFSSSLDI